MSILPDLTQNIAAKRLSFENKLRINRLANEVAKKAPAPGKELPVVLFFNASARLQGTSLNAAFSQLAAWGLRMNGFQTAHYVCQSGMKHCVLGTDQNDLSSPPPCKACIVQSRRLYQGEDVYWFQQANYPELEKLLNETDSFLALSNFSYQGIHLGQIVLPSLRWILRKHNLDDNGEHRAILKDFILGAWNVRQSFIQILENVKPDIVVIFNGIMYPEAMARQAALERNIRVITHEVAFQPFAAYFTDGQATAYRFDIPEDFFLNEKQQEKLDSYLEKRFQGNFTMAGIRFWPEMEDLSEDFLAKATQFMQIVPVFTNVIFDTSQVHANTVFEHMYDWLDNVQQVIRNHPGTLFVIRAHPDEMRPNTRKQSRESVRDWVINQGITALPNVVFIDSQEFVNSYALIHRAKFVMVYNSSIGLEASLLGKPVLCGGSARYSKIPTVFLPQSPGDYIDMAEDFLTSETISVPEEFKDNAEKFLYLQNFRVYVPFADYLKQHPRKGYVIFKDFHAEDLKSEKSLSVQILLKGILENKPFWVPEEYS